MKKGENMNFGMSVLLYNAMEAMVMIILINVCMGIKIDFKKLIFHSYLVGWINLIGQYLALENIKINPILGIVLNILTIPYMYYVLFGYYFISKEILKIDKLNIKRFKLSCIFSVILNALSVVMSSLIFKLNLEYIFDSYYNFNEEFFTNLFARCITLIFILLIFKIKRKSYINE